MLSLLGVHYHFRLTSLHYLKSTKQGSDPRPPFWQCQDFESAYSANPSLIWPMSRSTFTCGYYWKGQRWLHRRSFQGFVAKKKGRRKGQSMQAPPLCKGGKEGDKDWPDQGEGYPWNSQAGWSEQGTWKAKWIDIILQHKSNNSMLDWFRHWGQFSANCLRIDYMFLGVILLIHTSSYACSAS